MYSTVLYTRSYFVFCHVRTEYIRVIAAVESAVDNSPFVARTAFSTEPGATNDKRQKKKMALFYTLYTYHGTYLIDEFRIVRRYFVHVCGCACESHVCICMCCCWIVGYLRTGLSINSSRLCYVLRDPVRILSIVSMDFVAQYCSTRPL